MELDLSLRKVNNCSVVGRAAVFVRHKNSCLLHCSGSSIPVQGCAKAHMVAESSKGWAGPLINVVALSSKFTFCLLCEWTGAFRFDPPPPQLPLRLYQERVVETQHRKKGLGFLVPVGSLAGITHSFLSSRLWPCSKGLQCLDPVVHGSQRQPAASPGTAPPPQAVR